MHRDVAIILKCMAQIYHERDNFEQALALYQQALAAAKTSLGVHAETASIYNKLGNLFYEHQDFDNSIAMYEQGLAVERSVLHSLHPNIVVTLSNLGQVSLKPTGFLRMIAFISLTMADCWRPSSPTIDSQATRRIRCGPWCLRRSSRHST
jgi:tetratricopeptide (TPR) repeat protein